MGISRGSFYDICPPGVRILTHGSILGMRPTPFSTPSLNTAEIGRIGRSLVVMGCVLDVFMRYNPVLNEDIQKGPGGIRTRFITAVVNLDVILGRVKNGATKFSSDTNTNDKEGEGGVIPLRYVE